MVSKLLDALRGNYLGRTIGRTILQTLNLHKPTLEKRRILKKANELSTDDLAIDCTSRHGVVIFHDINNPLIGRGDAFEPEIQQCLAFLLFVDRLRGNNPRFGDIGANIGLHTMYLKEAFPDLEIVAFDPSPMSWKFMQLTLDYNAIKGVELKKHALGDNEGVVDFFAWGKSSSADSLKNTGRTRGVPGQTIQIPIRKLDSCTDIGPLTVIKMDCEGAELDILKGMRKRLAKEKPLIVTEFNRVNQLAFAIDGELVFSTVDSLGYQIFSMSFAPYDRVSFLNAHRNDVQDFILLPKEMSILGVAAK